jgi:hypothetical protein
MTLNALFQILKPGPVSTTIADTNAEAVEWIKVGKTFGITAESEVYARSAVGTIGRAEETCGYLQHHLMVHTTYIVVMKAFPLLVYTYIEVLR